ncbi:hypothetical protein [Nostoc sp.]|uniref:hypothetical protein n=1 Tax=Nostoc sp. TaxID=1180 RepID=UPI002FF614A8
MPNSIEPNDSPIWRFLSEHHPTLPTDKKQELLRLLQDSGIPPTDKIFPWIVETAITRIEMASLKAKLAQTDSNLQGHPEQLKKSLELVLNPYLKEVGHARIASDTLTQELRAAAVIEASIAESGWRGIGAALAAIFKHQNLMTVVGILVGFGGVLGFAIAWKLVESNRLLLDRNQQVIQACNKKLGF